MIAIVDYGVGNLFSLHASLQYLNIPCTITADADVLREAKQIILPGVGAFGDAMTKLRQTGLVPVLDTLAGNGKPLLGICLGMQLLYEESHEYGLWRGLGYIKGHVKPLQADLPAGMKVPHIGWNSLRILDDREPLLRDTREGDFAYYVHSYYVKDADESLRAVSDYGVVVPGVVRQGNVCGTQFHPEKSGKAGLAMLKAFAEATA